MSSLFEQVGHGIFSIDTQYVRPRLDASHLIVSDGRAAFVDAGTSFSVPNLLMTLAAQGLEADDVDYLLLTHIHLDHAGGAGRLAAALPRAKIVVHPRGASHMIDPRILVAATTAVYGEERFARDYGQILPIPAERVIAVADGQRLSLGARTLEFMYTPGHAMHHVCIVDRDAGDVFTGDTFGLSYRELDTAAGAFIFPTTSPTQFDPGQLHDSIGRIVELRPRNAYLTHYSRVVQIDKLGADLHADIDAFVSMAREVTRSPTRVADLSQLLYDYLDARLDAHGFTGGAAVRHAVMDDDIALNAAGLDAWLSRVAS